MVTEISHTWSQKQKSAITETAAAVASRHARENGRKEKTKKALSPRKEKRRLELARTTRENRRYMSCTAGLAENCNLGLRCGLGCRCPISIPRPVMKTRQKTTRGTFDKILKK